MKGILYIPYGNGDAVKGFKYDKPLTAAKFVKMETDEYENHKDGVDTMMYTRYGSNMAINTYEKRRFNYTKQKYDFFECPCYVLDMNGRPQQYKNLADYVKNQEQFILILNLNDEILKKETDLEESLKMWFNESLKVKKCTRLTDVEVMQHLPKKDFKLKVLENNNVVVLKDCKFVKFMSTSYINSFAIIVNKVVFVKE